MKIIEDITVKVTYTVGLGGLEVSDELYKLLCSMEGKELETGYVLTNEEEKAMDWLSSNIEEHDAMEWSYEIEEIKESKDENRP